MDSKNLAIIFAPTIFRPDMLDPVKAIMELKLAQVLIREILERHTILYSAVQQMMMASTNRTPAETKELLGNPVLTSLPVPEPRAYRRVESRSSQASQSVRSLIDGLGDLNTTDSANLEHLGETLSPKMIGRLGGTRGRGKSAAAETETTTTTDTSEQLEGHLRREGQNDQIPASVEESELEQVDN